GITWVRLQDRSACIAASLKLDSSHTEHIYQLATLTAAGRRRCRSMNKSAATTIPPIQGTERQARISFGNRGALIRHTQADARIGEDRAAAKIYWSRSLRN
ncbi:MAG: hypothetical protein ACRESB_23080, partial [Pseudomonas sp.]